MEIKSPTEQEIRREIRACESYGVPSVSAYLDALRALLEARELLLGCDAAMVIALNQHGLSTITTVVLESCQAKVRAFLAEGESK